ncbi:uncharacterized protein LOC142978989 [Anticarsia gemmatalis]|uniref:uncharacterized protein LOC142978989 n=1 Tax=Anticarsia gemmatalis TaxID=129554 RepID=UPI003F765C0D
MYRFLQLCCLCYVFVIAFILIDFGNANQTHHLQKRYLSFRNMTRSFLRINFKANIIPWNQIFAQAIGFRMNWDNPPDTFRYYKHHHHHPVHRRSVYNHLEELLEKNGLNGFHCVRRTICEMETILEPQKIYHKLLKMVFRQQSSMTEKWHNKTSEDCVTSISMCPFSMLDVSLYTDTV